jgi:uncharacterized LabA/DUF88 family protein
MERVIAYVDGFNLYFGLRDSGWRRFYWLNVQRLAQNLLKPSQQLITTKYFTARISKPQDKQRRQSLYIEALETVQQCRIFYGKYQSKPHVCNNCGYRYMREEEKMTDVNIAVELLTDAFQNQFDTAFLISADSDLSAPILAVKNLFPAKRIVAFFPPQRSSAELMKIVSAYSHINRNVLAKSQFPDRVRKADGFVLRRPQRWR